MWPFEPGLCAQHMSLAFLHVVVCVCSLLQFAAEQHSMVWMYRCLFILLSVGWMVR